VFVLVLFAAALVSPLALVLLGAAMHPLMRALGLSIVNVEGEQPAQRQRRQHRHQPAARPLRGEGADKGIKAR
jgi:hypothetical protein